MVADDIGTRAVRGTPADAAKVGAAADEVVDAAADPSPATTLSGDAAALAMLRDTLRETVDAIGRGEWAVAASRLAAIAARELDHLDAPGLFARAAELRESIRQRRRLRANRLALAAVCLASGAGVFLLLLIPVGRTRVAATVRTSTITFRAVDAWSLEDIFAEIIDLSGVDTLVVDAPAVRLASIGPGDAAAGTEGSPGEAANDQQRVKLVATTAFAQATLVGAGLLLDHLDVPAGAWTTLQGGAGSTPRLMVQVRGAAAGQAVAAAGLRLTTADLATRAGVADLIEAPDGGLVVLKSDSTGVWLDVTAARAAPIEVARNVDLDSVDFTERNLDRPRSGIRGGTLRLPEYDREPVILERGDRLALRAGSGLQAMSLDYDSAFIVHLSGDVSRLSLNGRSLQPSLLAWLSEHRQAVLLLGVLSSVLSFAWLALARFELLRT